MNKRGALHHCCASLVVNKKLIWFNGIGHFDKG